MRCRNCGFENPAAFKFCGNCGAALTTQAPAPKSKRKEHERHERAPTGSPLAEHKMLNGERRHLTVMFCDLAGATALSERLDPEELRQVVSAYQEVCAEAISRFEGHIAQYLGDGILVYFGYPQAHEDDAQSAVRSGLRIVEAMQQLRARLQGDMAIDLAVRVGIHTGLVVVGEMGGGARREQLALGETPNVAARLQGLADPNAVVISAATFRLIQGFFDCQALGARKLKGISHPLTVFHVLRETQARSRLEVAVTAGLTPLVGKKKEVESLLEAWQSAKAGNAQIVFLCGEAGIGKSRLLQAFKERVAEQPHAWLECRCWPYHQNSALYPLIEMLQRRLEFRREDSPEAKRLKLEERLAQRGLSLPEVMPLFADLLSVPLGERYSPLNLTPQRQRQKTLEALQRALLQIAAHQPVVFVVEDLHWADPSTLEMLGLFIAQPHPARIFILLTFRPEFIPPWPSRPDLTRLSLTHLDDKQTKMMVTQVTGGKALPAPVLKQIVAKTDGIPLFVEELTKMVIESGLLRQENDHFELTGRLPPLAIPATLHDSLMARLDRLSPVKEIAQLGATIGREFSYELIAAVADLEATTLRQGLAQLVQAELLYEQQAENNGTTYVFKHALIQDAAYESLLKSTRQQYHQRIAQVLVEQFPETATTQPEILAHHYTEAGLRETAAAYWQWAGEQAIQHSANIEALSHFTKGLELLRSLPESAPRHQQELDLLTPLGLALIATRGYADPEVEKTYTRARELCQQMGAMHHLSPVLLGLWECALIRVNLPKAHALAQEFMQFAQSQADPVVLLSAHLTLGITLFCLAELTAAREHLEQALRLYDPIERSADVFVYGQDPGVVSLSYSAFALWLLGYPDQALKYGQEAFALAQKLAHPFTLAMALNFSAGVHELRRESQIVLERAETLLALASEQGFTFWRACGLIQKGSVLIEFGKVEEGVALLEEGAQTLQATGAQIGIAGGLVQRAYVYGKMGQSHVEEALKLVEEAQSLVRQGLGERHDEAEQVRIKGELMCMRAVPDEQQAEACFLQAIDIACRQQAKSLELRAAMSLARLWQKQGKQEEARSLLAEIYHWFTEGFETADLQEAKVLLNELA